MSENNFQESIQYEKIYIYKTYTLAIPIVIK